MQPYDYSTRGMDPAKALLDGMAFGQQQRIGEQNIAVSQQGMDLAAAQEGRAQTQFGQQNTMFDQSQQDRATMLRDGAAARAQALQMQQDQADLYDKVASGNVTSADFMAFSTKYPDLANEMATIWDGQTKERKDADVSNIFKAGAAIKAGKPEIAVKMLEDRADAADVAGDKTEADLSRYMAEAIKADPAAGLTTLGMLLHSVDATASDTLFGVRQDRSVQSAQPYENGTIVTIFTNGDQQVTDAAGTIFEGQAALDAVKAAQDNEAAARGANSAAVTGGKLNTEIQLAGTAEATKEAGKQSITKSGEAYDALGKVNANILTIDEAVAAIDAGANSGAIARYFPNITSASASLENSMNKLGLDVIGSVTFGALSEGEMKLAMETAVPRNLDEPDLKAWLLRKKAAQEKASDALYNAAVYLGTPGNTLATWVASRPKKVDAPPVRRTVEELMLEAGKQ